MVMGKLYKRMLREIRTGFGQFFSIALIIAIGSMLMSGMFSAITAMDTSTEQYYEEQNFADLWVYFNGITQDDADQLIQDSGAEGAAPRYTLNEQVTVNGLDCTLRLHSLTEINNPLLTEGVLPQKTNEIILDYKFAQANSLSTGSTLQVGSETLMITGLFMNPEYAYKQKDSGASDNINRNFGIAYTTKETAITLIKASDSYQAAEAELQEKLKNSPTQLAEAESQLQQSAENYQEILFKTDQQEVVLVAAEKLGSYVSYVDRENQPSFVNVSGSLDPIRSVSYLFPLIFFLVAAIVAFISLSKSVENQRTQIAVMQALGISKNRIRYYFFSYAALASLSGAIPFALLGNYLIPKLLIRVFMSRFALPSPNVPIYLMYIVFPMALALFFSSFAALLAVQKVLQEIPAQAMRPRPPKGTKTILLERIPLLWKKLNYSGKLILRNIFLHKGRIFLSSVGVIGSVMLIFTGLSLQNSATQVIQTATDSISYDLSINYKDPIADINSLSFSFPVDSRELSETKKATLELSDNVDINLQLVESGSSMIRPFDQNGQVIQFDESSVLLPDSIAEEFGLSVGDPLSITIDNQSYTLRITGFCTQYTSKTLYLSFDSAAAAGMDTSAHSLLLTLPPNEDAGNAAKMLSIQENVKSTSTREDVISRSQDMLKTLNATILILLVSAVLLGMTVIYNIASINIFERTREYATLMVLGYYKKEVNRMIFRENIILTALGSLLGFPAGYYLFVNLAGVISQSNLKLPTDFNTGMAATTLLLTVLFALTTNLLLYPKIKKIVLVEALKSIE
ncbi:ABC transporter permease [Eubacteriaceae bacterium ES2]|nr:ABC transporter permease [Eubacteriaceae bacterium ES2]